MFWYYVVPSAETKWRVVFDGQRRLYSYDSADEALKAACKAAELRRKTQQMATGVRVKAGGDWRQAVTFGN